MARASAKPERRSTRTTGFEKQLRKLPKPVRTLFEKYYSTYCEDPNHQALDISPVKDSRKQRHRKRSLKLKIKNGYRALFCVTKSDGGEHSEWYWVGSREDYGTFLRCR